MIGGIRTHASKETGALNQHLRPLGHTTLTIILSGRHPLCRSVFVCVFHTVNPDGLAFSFF